MQQVVNRIGHVLTVIKDELQGAADSFRSWLQLRPETPALILEVNIAHGKIDVIRAEMLIHPFLVSVDARFDWILDQCGHSSAQERNEGRIVLDEPNQPVAHHLPEDGNQDALALVKLDVKIHLGGREVDADGRVHIGVKTHRRRIEGRGSTLTEERIQIRPDVHGQKLLKRRVPDLPAPLVSHPADERNIVAEAQNDVVLQLIMENNVQRKISVDPVRRAFELYLKLVRGVIEVVVDEKVSEERVPRNLQGPVPVHNLHLGMAQVVGDPAPNEGSNAVASQFVTERNHIGSGSLQSRRDTWQASLEELIDQAVLDRDAILRNTGIAVVASGGGIVKEIDEEPQPRWTGIDGHRE